MACAPGTYDAGTASHDCTRCAPGTYQDLEGNTTCKDCTPGYYCAEGSAAPLPCPGGTHKNASLRLMMSSDDCVACPAGTSCSVGSVEPAPCLPGSYGASPEQESCELCPEGKFTPNASNTYCLECTPGALCVEGSSVPQPCPGGTFANQTILHSKGYLSSMDECTACPAGHFCPIGASIPLPECGIGEYCPIGSSLGTLCALDFTTTVGLGAESSADCVCKPGRYMKPNRMEVTQDAVSLSDGWAKHLNGDRGCVECPANGIECREPGVTLEAMAIKPGFWRSHNLSITIRQCFRAEFCIGTTGLGLQRRLQDDGALQSVAWSEGCIDHHTGPYCELCVPNFIMTPEGCTVCGGSVFLSFVFPLVVLGMALLLAIRICRSKSGRKLVEHVSQGVVDAAFNAGKQASQGGRCEAGSMVESAAANAVKTGEENAIALVTGCQMVRFAPGPLGMGLNANQNGQVQVTSVDPGSAAEHQGVREGSNVREVNGVLTHDLPTEVVLALIEKSERPLTMTFSSASVPTAAPATALPSTTSRTLAMLPPGWPPDMSSPPASPPTTQVHAPTHTAVHKRPASLTKRVSEAAARRGCTHEKIAGLQVKSRILISLVQVIGQLGGVFSIPYPPFYNDLVNALGVFTLDIFQAMPLGCTIHLNHDHYLLMRTLAPLAILFVSFAYRLYLQQSAGRMRKAGHAQKGERAVALADKVLTLNFVLFYLLFPSNSAKIFATFQCEQLEDPAATSFLLADMSVDCKTPFHQYTSWYAAAMILVYPFGIPAMYSYLLFFRHHKELRALQSLEMKRVKILEDNRAARALASAMATLEGRSSGANATADQDMPEEVQTQIDKLQAQEDELRENLPDYVQKLILGYELRVYHFELFECMRKLAIVCMPVFFRPSGSVSQLMFGLVVCFLTFGAYMLYSPYTKDGDDYLAQLCQCQIFFALLSSTALKYDADDAGSNMGVLLAVLTILPLAFGALLELKPLFYPEERMKLRMQSRKMVGKVRDHSPRWLAKRLPLPTTTHTGLPRSPITTVEIEVVSTTAAEQAAEIEAAEEEQSLGSTVPRGRESSVGVATMPAAPPSKAAARARAAAYERGTPGRAEPTELGAGSN